jgi:hypothetical protein
MMDTPHQHMVNVLLKEENKYVEEILEACSNAFPIKTYTVIRENSFEELKDRLDKTIEFNPLMELSSKPLNLKFLGIDKWIAVVVEYDINN